MSSCNFAFADEQAASLKVFSTCNHLLTDKLLIGRTIEYNFLFHIGYEEALQTTKRPSIPQNTGQLQSNLDNNNTFNGEDSKETKVKRSTRQGDTMPSKLFSLALGSLKKIDWSNMRVSFNCERLREIVKKIFKNKRISQHIKSKIFDKRVFSVLTYGAQTWIRTKQIINKLQNIQRSME